MIDKQAIINHFNQVAPARPLWFRRNYMYHNQIIQACRPFLNPDSRVLELGCSTGDLLAALKPGFGVGVDFSPVSVEIAQQNHPHLEWMCADVEDLPDVPPLDEPFDMIVMADLIGYLNDIQQTLTDLRRLMHDNSRVVISLWNWMWQPILVAGERLHFKNVDSHVRQNWLSPAAIQGFLELTGYETVSVQPGVLLPYHVPGLTRLVNTLSYAPLFNRLVLLTTVVARPQKAPSLRHTSVSVIIPTRNEVENIEALVERVPEMGTHTELVFVDGASTDGTIEKIHEQIRLHPERDIKFIPQVPPQSDDADAPPDMMLKLGKGDAVRKGFAAAQGDIVMILDSDISVPPEELPRFYEALVAGKARMVNGTRFAYHQEAGAMRPLNYLGNVFFSIAFSWLLGQPISDTLCGTKALYKRDYDEIAANRSYFGDFDPFGDFDLLFGAARLRYRIFDVPVHYKARTYGTSKVRVSVHGPLLMPVRAVAVQNSPPVRP
jgi:SAM-dependent methyltransferase